MEEARAVLPYIKSLEDKYNVLYVNTPWAAMDDATLSKFPASSITPDNAAIFMWVDSYTVARAAKLIEQWGFTFHSVYQVLDVAKHPWMESVDAKAKPAAADKTDEAPAVKEEPGAEGGGAADTSAGKKKVNRKPRAPPISAPRWWVQPGGEPRTPSRPTTEQLWLAVKGDPSHLFAPSTLAFNVVNRPDLGKKSRSKKPTGSNEWDTERPVEFLQDMMRHLTPDAKVLNVFASAMKESVDVWGPGVPGGYLSSIKANAGIVGVLNKTLRALKKAQLHELVITLPKVMQDDTPNALSDISTWHAIETSMLEMPNSAGYNFKTDDGSVRPWVMKLVHKLSHDNMTNFTILHSKKKKRKASSATNPDRERHGIASKSVVSKELHEFLGLEDGETIARTQVVSLLNKYINKENLKDPVKKNQIVLDDKLAALLAPPDDFGVITFFNIGTLLKPHFPKSKKAIKEEEAKMVGAEKAVPQAKRAVSKATGPAKKKVCQ